uniref:MFS domain-containing protein n=1 Tax=Meloidogyne floridensis TaxID=298350 RepID=A0A915P7N7_9BILA
MHCYIPFARPKTGSMRTARDEEDNTISEATAETLTEKTAELEGETTAELERENTAISAVLRDDKTQIEKENEDSTVVSDTHTEQSLRAGLKLFSIPAKILIEWQRSSYKRIHGPDSVYKEEITWLVINCFYSPSRRNFSKCPPCFHHPSFWPQRDVDVQQCFCGVNMGLASIYLSEIAPINLRGAIGCMSNVFLYTGFLFALVVGLPFMLGDEENWNLIFLLSYIPVSVQLTLLGFFCPESPKYSYIVHGNFMEAERSLQLLRGRNDFARE